jgi:hypothetical protein
MANDLVGYSRAGDVFHYRWAARRCLKMLYPDSSLKFMVIEGSAEKNKAGEYVMDVSEYYNVSGASEKINYFQLKHSTLHKDDPFTLSELEKTLTGFAERFKQHSAEKRDTEFSFTVLTNRKIDLKLKSNVEAVVQGRPPGVKFKSALEKYTGLSGQGLTDFCRLLVFEDTQGDYNAQKSELRIEIDQLVAGSLDHAYIDSITALVQEKVMPDSIEGRIVKEEVLKRLGITSQRELFPASAIWETDNITIKRKQHDELICAILAAEKPVIVHAAGGVGKSVFSRQLVKSLPEGSVGIAYDCFGAGRYRNRSETRHLHRDALVQIANELAAKGLCSPLFVQNTTLEKDIVQKFILRLSSAVNSLQKAFPSAALVVLIDAADNAEMAAAEFNQTCFAHELLREEMPPGCRLVFLCRTERIEMLKPLNYVQKFELEAFGESETLENLRNFFAEASEKDGGEFHRLTNGNPRVQMNALNVSSESVADMLEKLGPAGTTVEEQIKMQLESAVGNMKDRLPSEFHGQINSICVGLATLSPHIPIFILARAAGVSPDSVKSFVVDIGRSLWITDESVQFRDEPTETWFRNQFFADRINLENYIASLEPLSQQFTYAAEVLPQLYLQAEQYDKLIHIALSDQYLPEDNPIDARNVRVYRLQFAFKAALKSEQYKDAVKLAMRAGEEAASDKRQLSLLKNNIGLLVRLQSREKIQTIALKGLLEGNWSGSENIYSASLLSSIQDFKGEARGFLRAARNWLEIYFQETRKKKKDFDYERSLEDLDLVEMSFAYLNIEGADACLEFLNSLKPQNAVFRIVRLLTVKLIDINDLDAVYNFMGACREVPYFVIAICGELMKTGNIPSKQHIETCLRLLAGARTRIKINSKSIHDEHIIAAVLYLCEASFKRGLPAKLILKVLAYYVKEKPSDAIADSHFHSDRNIFFRALALRQLIKGQQEINVGEITPENLKKENQSHQEIEKKRSFEQTIQTLYPWYLVRLLVLKAEEDCLSELLKKIILKPADAFWYSGRRNFEIQHEISEIYISITVFASNENPAVMEEFYEKYIKENTDLKIPNWLFAVRAAFRLPHLGGIKSELELKTYDLIKSDRHSYTDKIAGFYIKLASGVLPNSAEDASVYFNEAVDIVSKFGDEIIQRWEATASLAKKASAGNTVPDQLAYRFIRVAELVGENSKEKYWSRAEAIRICAKMSPSTAIASLSRWRDRDVGRFKWLLDSLLIEFAFSKLHAPSVTTSLSCFLSQLQLESFVPNLLCSAMPKKDKQIILDDTVKRYRLEGIHVNAWELLHDAALSNDLENAVLNKTTAFYKTIDKDSFGTGGLEKILNQEQESFGKFDWSVIFKDVDLAAPDGFSMAVKLFEDKQLIDSQTFIPKSKLWEKISETIEEKKLFDFVESVFLEEELGIYDAVKLLAALSVKWSKKISFQKKWPSIIMKAGEKYAEEIIAESWFNFAVENLKLTDELQNDLKRGILQRLSEGTEFENAGTFFGFARIASSLLSAKEAESLASYSLSRFEMHMPDYYGDGLWSEWMQVSSDINESTAGFIWSALGSPMAEMRWQATHCVRKLAELGALDLLEAIMQWLELDKADGFGSEKYPFYNLHARQYLLIALARVSMDKPEILCKYSRIFVKHCEFEHIIIHKFAFDIILNIEKAFPGTYESSELTSLKYMGLSSMPAINVKYGDKRDSWWHSSGEIKKNKKQLFAFDFDKYWFEPLGDVFAVSGLQVQDLAASVLKEKWKVDLKGYNADPRVEIWNRSSRGHDTEHSHSSYPKTDNLSFYYSYHSLMAAASKLIKKMPVAITDYFEESDDNWQEWLTEHLLTRSDGKWLSDIRDELPLVRPGWIDVENNKDWDSQIRDDDFVKCILTEEKDQSWINVAGYWNEKENDRKESYIITSALVSPESSESLLNALSSCTDPYDAHLPEYEENDAEIDVEPFMLKGWIEHRNAPKGIDSLDPFSGNASYSSYVIGEKILEKLKESASRSENDWHLPMTLETALLGRSWNSFTESKNEESAQSGTNLKITVPFLKFLCKTLGCEIIFNVRIQRNYNRQYGSLREKYNLPILKIYLFSEDGKLRSIQSGYQLG